MNKEEIEESPYCEICGHCGYIGCCGISNFIDKHIKGKTNCKNEKIIINELEDLCDYQTETFKENKLLQSKLDIANKKLDKIKEIINSFLDNWECGGALTEYHITGEPPSKDLQDILSIIGGE